MFNFLKKAVQYISGKVDDVLELTKKKLSSQYDVEELSNSELRRRVNLVKEAQKQLTEKESASEKPFVTLTGEQQQMSGLDYWKQTKNYERYQNVPSTIIPESVKTDADLKKLNDFLERALSDEKKEEQLKIYRENIKKALDDIFEEDMANDLKEKFRLISDEKLNESFRVYEVLDIHSWSPPEGIASQNPLADIYNDISNSLDKLLDG